MGVPAPADSSSAVLYELLGSSALAVGVALLIGAVVVRMFSGSWVKTHAVAFLRDGQWGLRWHTTRYHLHEVLLQEPLAGSPEPGTELILYYHSRDPDRWSTSVPDRGIRALLFAGLLLSLVGIVLAFTPR